MSWVEKVKRVFAITTGDGKRFEFDAWMNPTKELPFNVSPFDYVNVPGTDVTRKKPKGRIFNIEVYLQGEDNLDKSEAFEASAKDSRYWTVRS